MKICPQCQNTYTDDSLQFCLQDGNPLNSVNTQNLQNPTASWNESDSEPATVIRNEPNQMRININEPKVIPPQTYSTTPQTEILPIDSPKKSNLPMILVGSLLGLIAVLGIGGVVAWNLLSPKEAVIVQNNNVNGANSNSSINSNSSVNSNSSTANTNIATPPTPVPPTPKPTLKPAEIESAKKEVESTVYGWKSSAENINLDANISNYADSVDYYKGGKISKTKLKSSKAPAYKKYDSIQIEIKDMKVATDPSGDKATVTFDKDWDFAGVDKDGNDVINRGSVQQQLILNKVGGKWKIVSEKELKIHWTDKGAAKDDEY